LTKFISKAGRPFPAYLVMDDTGKATFEFPPRENRWHPSQRQRIGRSGKASPETIERAQTNVECSEIKPSFRDKTRVLGVVVSPQLS